MGVVLLSFLEAIRLGSGPVDAHYAGWLIPRDQRELAILGSPVAQRARLPGWVRDEISDRIAEIVSNTVSAKVRDKMAELSRHYLRPIAPKNLTASRASLSNWRREAAELLADELIATHSDGLAFQLTGLPQKGEHLNWESLSRDPAVRWILNLDPQERDIAIHRGLSDAADEARNIGNQRTRIGVEIIASRLAPAMNSEPTHDFDGKSLHDRDGRKFTRSRLALPLVLFCLQRAALVARQPAHLIDRHDVFVVSHRLLESISGPPTRPGPLSSLDVENKFDSDRLSEAIAYAWRRISTEDAGVIVAALTRYASLASGMITDRQRQDLALLSIAVARRHSDRRGLNIDLNHRALVSDSSDSVLFQLHFRRERLLLASHHSPGSDWRPELQRINDLLVVRKRILPAEELRHAEKVQHHLRQGVLLRLARERATGGRPMDTITPGLTDDQIRVTIRALENMVASIRRSFYIADRDSDQLTAVNAHRRRTEADGVVHLLSRLSHPDALAGARRLRRDLNSLDDVYLDQFGVLRTDAKALWLLAMADQAVRFGETEQARHYLKVAVAALPEGIPHLAIRSANLAAAIGETELTKLLVDKIPKSRVWPSYLEHLVARLRSGEP